MKKLSRSLFRYAQEEDQDNLPADMYYACLDSTLNDDGNDRCGEVGEDDIEVKKPIIE